MEISRRNLLRGVAASVSLAVLIPAASVLVSGGQSLPPGWRYVVERYDHDYSLSVAVVSDDDSKAHGVRMPGFTRRSPDEAKTLLDGAMKRLRTWVEAQA